jgi:O-antigen/teichoic acid export membrane protein
MFNRAFNKIAPMIQKILSSQLRINMVSGIVTAVINTVVLFVAFKIYLHFLGWETYGVWAILATVLTFAQLGDIGISQAVIKLVAEGYGRGDIEDIQRYVTTALTMLCLSGAVILAIILVFKGPIVDAFKLSDKDSKTVLWLLPYISILSVYVLLVQSFNSILSGMGRMDLVNYIQSIGRMLSVIIVIILLSSGFGVVSLLIGSTISYLFIHISSFICIRRIAKVHFLRLRNLDFQRAKRILHFGGAVFSSSLMGMFISPFNKLMLSRYTGVSAVAVYETALALSSQIRGLIETGLRPLMPAISSIGVNMTTDIKNKISQMNINLLKLIFIFGGSLYCLFAIFSPLLLKLWLRDKFVEPLPDAFRIMLVATFITLVGAPAYHTIVGLGKLRYFIIGTIISTCGNFVLVTTYCVLIKHLSVNIVGWCMVVSFAASAAYFIFMAHRLFVSDNELKPGEISAEPTEIL